ncbi:hypothetical protein SZ30_32200 [Burkholderia pseudomallei]|nr:hypothetical protein SZ30_32200 [Burkholderia pseudomallei]
MRFGFEKRPTPLFGSDVGADDAHPHTIGRGDFGGGLSQGRFGASIQRQLHAGFGKFFCHTPAQSF